MSTRATRSSARKAVNGKSTPSVEKSTKSVVSERRRQRKKVDDLQNNVNGEASENSDGEVHVTPPKQRKPCEKANALSPSTLLHRLSLGEQNENQPSNVIVEKPKKESKIDNARKVLNAAETEELYGREQEMTELNDFLSTNLANKTSASIYISGQPGKSFVKSL